jgi:hypothetical protein
MPLIAIAHFSKSDLWDCEQISGQCSDRVYHNYLGSDAIGCERFLGGGQLSLPPL